MASATRVTVGVTATKLVDQGGAQDPVEVRLKNIGAATVFIGGAGVTTATGYELAAAAETPEPITLAKEDSTLYGIVVTGTCVVEVLVI